jgi:hypothetical protein
MHLLPEDHAECLAGLEPDRGDAVDPLVARDEDEPFLGRVVEEDVVVDSFTEGIDRPNDLPAPTKKSFDDGLTDVVVREGGKAGHY